MKYKIGDIVEATADCEYIPLTDNEIKIGDLGVVVGHDGTEPILYLIDFKGYHRPLNCYGEEIKLSKSSKFDQWLKETLCN